MTRPGVAEGRRIGVTWVATFLAAVALTLPAASAPIAVEVTTRDGNSLIGTSDRASLRLEIETGTVEVQLPDWTVITFEGKRATVRGQDGTTLQGNVSLAAWPVKTKVGVLNVPIEQIASVTVRPENQAPPPAAPPPPSPARAAPAPRVGPAVPPLGTLDRDSCIAALHLSPDKTRLYALEVARIRTSSQQQVLLDEAHLLVLDADTFALKNEIPLPKGAVAMAIPASGASCYVVGRSWVVGVDLRAGTAGAPVELQTGYAVSGVYARDDRTLYVSSGTELLEIAVPQGTVVRTFPGTGGNLCPTPDGSALYAVRPHPCAAKLIFSDASQKGGGELRWAPAPRWSKPVRLRITPDGRRAIAITGEILRLGRSPLSDLLLCGQVEPHLASILLPKSGRLFLFTWAGTLKELHPTNYAAVQSIEWGIRVLAVEADEEKMRLYVIAETGTPSVGPDYYAQLKQETHRHSVALYSFAIPAAR